MADLSKPFKIACAIDNDACYDLIEKGQRRMFIRGKASGTQIDRDHERVAESAIVSIQKAIEDGILNDDGELTRVPLMSEHEKRWDDVLGSLTKAWVDDNWDLWIEAELDADNPRSHYLYNRLKKSGANQKKLGLSIGGRVLEAGQEFINELGKSIRVFYDVGLDEVSVTSRPAYPTAYLNALSKSVTWDGVQGERQAVVSDTIMKSYRHKESIMPTEEQIIEKSDEVVETVEEQPIEKAEETVEVEEAAVEKAETEETVEEEAAVEKTETIDEEPSAEDDVTKSEEVEETPEAVEKTEGEHEEEPIVEKASTQVRISMETWADAWDGDPMGALKNAVESIMREVEDIKGVLKSVNVTPSEDEVEKSEEIEETQEEPVEKTASTEESAEVVEKTETEGPSEDVIAKALHDTLGAILDEKLAPVAALIEGLEKRIDEVENAEADGSISVSKAIGNMPEDSDEEQYVALKKNLDALPTGADRLAFLLKRQMGS